MTDDTDRIQRFLDDLGRLSSRHDLAIEWTPYGMRLGSFGGVRGYAAWPDDSGCYSLDAVSVGYTPETEGEIVSADWSPDGRADRARQWREDNAEAIAAQAGSATRIPRRMLGLLEEDDTFAETFRQSRGALDPETNLAPEDPDPRTLAAGAIEHACRQHGVELRATPGGFVMVPAREDWQGYEWREAEHPAGAVFLVDRAPDREK